MHLVNVRDNAIRSFIFVIYDGGFNELAHYQVPISVAAPFANRLFKEVLNIPNWRSSAREPWYSLAPRTEPKFQRSSIPVGLTSLYGERFDPDSQPAPLIHMHPGATVHSFVVRLYDFQEQLYEGEHSVDDLFLHGAYYLLHHGVKKDELSADQGPYYYAVVPSTHTVRSVSKSETRIQFKPVP